MNTDSLVVYINTKHIYVHIPKDVETRSDTSWYEIDISLPFYIYYMKIKTLNAIIYYGNVARGNKTNWSQN